MSLLENKTFDVAFWRQEFLIEKKRLGRGWRKFLIGNKPLYDSYEGVLMLDQVNAGRASLARTQQVVTDMQNITPTGEKKPKTQVDAARDAAIEKSLRNLERPAERVMKEGKARRDKIKADYETRLAGHRKKKVNQ